MVTIPPELTQLTQRPMAHVARELAASNGFLLARLGIGFKARALARAEADGFELYDYSVLALLAEGDRVTQSTIADVLGVDPSRLVAVLDSLEQRDLVARHRDPQDRRRHVVTITAGGNQQLLHLRELVRRLEDDFFAPLDEAKRKTLHDLLIELAAQNDPDCCPLAVDPAA